MDFQFYPTPRALARRMWDKFKNRDFERILEPHGGEGALIEACPEFESYGRGMARGGRCRVAFDTCEIDVTKHPVLRSKGANVVGMDFLRFGSGSIYSHIILNPPFADGEHHMLKAWDILWDGEIVGLVNAETLRNPCTAPRRQLLKLVMDHGDVEYVEGAFMVPDAQRKTPVDVAIIYLCKKVDVQLDITGDLLHELAEDKADGDSLAGGYEELKQLALPKSAIENLVTAFKAAVKTMTDAVKAEAKARYYESLLGETMAVRSGQQGAGIPPDHSISFVRSETAKRYEVMKDKAWTSVLRSSSFEEKLSSVARKEVESQFESIKRLEFTVQNIYGFLLGLVESQGEIQEQMILHCFDEITKYHSENTVFFMGWRSNDKHRTCGYRMKTTRFILPHFTSWSHSLDYNAEQRLVDFDKVFAMMAGDSRPAFGLADAFRRNFDQLRRGERVETAYFDVRYYPGRGTVHFFARDKELVDRFNRYVGRLRKWLPPEHEPVSKDFWKQYEKAEKFDAEVRAEARKGMHHHWDDPVYGLLSKDGQERAKVEERMANAMATVLERNGIRVDFQVGLEEPPQEQQLLLPA